MKEIWKDVVGYEGLYRVSNLGRVKSLPKIRNCSQGKTITKEIILKPRPNRSNNHNDYLRVGLIKDYLRKHYLVHRLVALSFIKNNNNLKEINHKDCNKQNNNVNNLEWCTRGENISHAYKNNRRSSLGINNGRAIINGKQAMYIKKSDLDNNILAKMFGLKPGYIYNIKNNKSWKHI